MHAYPPDLYELACSGAAFCALVFCWGMVAEMAFFGVWICADDVNLDFSNSSPLARVAQYTLIIVVVAGAGMIVLAGVVGVHGAWDALVGVLAAKQKIGLIAHN